MSAWVYGGIAVALLALLSWGGFEVYSAGKTAGVADGMAQQQAADQKIMDQRVADEKAAAAATTKQLASAQAETGKLNTDLSQVRSQLSQAQQDAAHAKFTNPRTTAPVAGACPGSAFGSDDFVRLWNGSPEAAVSPPDPASKGSGAG